MQPSFFQLKSRTFQTKYKPGFGLLLFSGKKDMALPAGFFFLFFWGEKTILLMTHGQI